MRPQDACPPIRSVGPRSGSDPRSERMSDRAMQLDARISPIGQERAQPGRMPDQIGGAMDGAAPLRKAGLALKRSTFER